MVVFRPHFLGSSQNDLPIGSGQFCQIAFPAFEPPDAPLLQAERQHGQDPQLRLQVQQGRLVRPLPTLEESQQAVLHGLPRKFCFTIT